MDFKTAFEMDTTIMRLVTKDYLDEWAESGFKFPLKEFFTLGDYTISRLKNSISRLTGENVSTISQQRANYLMLIHLISDLEYVIPDDVHACLTREVLGDRETDLPEAPTSVPLAAIDLVTNLLGRSTDRVKGLESLFDEYEKARAENEWAV